MNHVTILSLKWMQFVAGRGTTENREHVVEGRGFMSV